MNRLYSKSPKNVDNYYIWDLSGNYPKVTDENKRNIYITKSMRHKLKQIKKRNLARSYNHVLHMILTELDMNRSMLIKLNAAIRRAHKEDDINFFMKIFNELATDTEKAYYEALIEGCLEKN